MLSPMLLEAYNCILDKKMVAPSLQDTIVEVSYKEGKDPSECRA